MFALFVKENRRRKWRVVPSFPLLYHPSPQTWVPHPFLRSRAFFAAAKERVGLE